jgi:hypothetical protein
MPTICVDFDGVINPYISGYQGKGNFEKPFSEVEEVFGRLKEMGWVIIIYTCRREEESIKKYLEAYRIPFDYINYNPRNEELGLSNKISADIYLDDRAICFEGEWDGILERILGFRRWSAKLGED